jgi:hypothetical protein
MSSCFSCFPCPPPSVVREAIEQKKWKEADQQMARVGMVLEDEAALIDSAAAELERQR